MLDDGRGGLAALYLGASLAAGLGAVELAARIEERRG